MKWAHTFTDWSGETYSVVEVGVPKNVLDQMQVFSKMDGIGPALFAAEGPVLDGLNKFLVYINVLP